MQIIIALIFQLIFFYSGYSFADSSGIFYEQELIYGTSKPNLTLSGKNIIYDNETVTISANAEFCDSCSPFYYWYVTGGVLQKINGGQSVIWTPPDVVSTDSDFITCTIGDGKGNISTNSIELMVLDSGSSNVDVAIPILSGDKDGEVNESLTFRSLSVSNNNLALYYRFDWDDGTPGTSWGSEIHTHEWTAPGSYCVKAWAKDENGNESPDSSDCFYVTIKEDIQVNQPPNTPTITGPAIGSTGFSYTFTANTTDPENDPMQYRFQFLNDTTDWKTSNTASFTWGTGSPGHIVRAQAKDSNGNVSDWSNIFQIEITQSNRPPYVPQFAGTTFAIPGTSYDFRAWGFDRDRDPVCFQFDWGDGTKSNCIPAQPDDSATTFKSWTVRNTYCVKVQAIDDKGLTSGWSDCKNVRVDYPNQLPTNNGVTGPVVGYINNAYQFTASASDPENNPLEYEFKLILNNGDIVRSGWQSSDTFLYNWSEPGTYCIKVGVRDNPIHVPIWSGCHNIDIFSAQVPCRINLFCPDPDTDCANLCNGGYGSPATMTISWSDEDGNSASSVTSIDLYYSLYGGEWVPIAMNQPPAAYYWSIPPNFVHDNIHIRLVGHYNTGCTAEAISKPLKTIDKTPPTASLDALDAGPYYVNEPVEIRWNAQCAESSAIERVDLGLMSSDDVYLTGDKANSGVYTWYPKSVDVNDSAKIQMRVWCENCTDIITESNSFAITQPHNPNIAWAEGEHPFTMPPRSWTQELYSPDVVVEDDGTIHLIAIYMDSYGGVPRQGETQIYYRKKASGTWNTQEQATSYIPWNSLNSSDVYEIRHPRMTIDSNGYPHIVYEYFKWDTEIPDVYYIRRTSSGWTTPVNISNSSAVRSLDPEIVMSSDNRAYIFWYEESNGIKYVSTLNGSLSGANMITPINTTPYEIMMDQQDILHLTGIVDSETAVRYMKMVNGVWSASEVASTTYPEELNIYQLNGKLFISNRNAGFFLLRKESNGWTEENYTWTEDKSDEGYRLWADGGGNLHLVYRGLDSGNEYMLEKMFDGSAWSEYQVISPYYSQKRYASDGNENILATAWETRYNSIYDVFISTADYSTVSWPPSITSFTAQPASGNAPLNVNFQVQAIPGNSPITEYTFIFGDGESFTQTGNTAITHIYTEAGEYTASVVVKGADGLTSSSSVQVTVNPAPLYEMRTVIFPDGGGSISGEGLECEGTCSHQYSKGTTVTLYAQAKPDYEFSHWSGCDSASGTECTVTMNSAKEIFAAFNCKPVGIPVVWASGNEVLSGYEYTIHWVPDATAETYIIEESTDRDFTNIISTHPVNDTSKSFVHSSSGRDVYYYRITANSTCSSDPYWSNTVSITVKEQTYPLTVSVNPQIGGTVTDDLSYPVIYCPDNYCRAEYTIGETVRLTAQPKPGFEFDSWSGCDQVSTNICTVNINSFENVVANFRCIAADEPTLSVSSASVESGESYRLSWNSAGAEVYYRIEESSDPSFSAMTAYTTTETGKSFMKEPVGNTNYYYRLVAVRSCGSESPFSNSVSISVDAVSQFNTGADISLGYGHTLLLKGDGTVLSWGLNEYGQLGTGDLLRSFSPVPVPGLDYVVRVFAGYNHSIALKEDGTLWFWGHGAFGQFGNGSVSKYNHTPVQGANVPGIIDVSAGFGHNLVLTEDGTLWAFGLNDNGQLGNNSTANASAPVQVPGMTDVAAIAAGYKHSTVLKKDGTVWTWGNNAFGQLGNGTKTVSYTPVQVSGLSNITEIFGGYYHSFAKNTAGTVYAWGANERGQLGDGTYINRTTPVAVSAFSGATYIVGGFVHTLVRKPDGTVWAAGINRSGQIGYDVYANQPSLVQVGGIDSSEQIAAGNEFSAVTKADGSIWMWGANDFGQLGNCESTRLNLPYKIPELVQITDISAGFYASYAVDATGKAWAWGDYKLGIDGIGIADRNTIPVPVPSFSGVLKMEGGYNHVIALKNDGTVWSWGGLNNAGQLGVGTTTVKEAPVKVLNLSSISDIASNSLFSFAIDSSKNLWGWGWNSVGQIGDGTTTNRTAPVHVTSLSNVDKVDVGEGHAIALTGDGKVWTWGWNKNGQLGNGTNTNSSIPVQLAGLPAIVDVCAGYQHSMALDSSGYVWAWGYNQYGTLGIGTTSPSNTPVKIFGLDQVTAVSAGYNHSLAIRSDGTVWAWGHGGFAQLGDGEYNHRLSPIQVKGILNAKAVDGGHSHTLILKNDGTVTAFGYNNYGQVGNDVQLHIPEPAQGSGCVGTLNSGDTTQNEVILNLSDTEAQIGATVPVPISLDNSTLTEVPVYSAQFRVRYNPAIGIHAVAGSIEDTSYRLNGRTEGFSANVIVSQVGLEEEALVLLYSLNGESIYPGKGAILELLFETDATATAGGISEIRFQECVLSDTFGIQISSNCMDTGIITVMEPLCELGDLNCDFRFDVFDVQAGVNCILTTGPCDGFDLNTDGIYNIMDLQGVINKVVESFYASAAVTGRSAEGRSTVTASAPNTISLQNIRVEPNTQGVVGLNLSNSEAVSSLQVEFSYDSTSGFDILSANPTDRTAGFAAPVLQMERSDPRNVKVLLLLYSFGQSIAPGSGGIIDFEYHMGSETDEIGELVFTNVKLADASLTTLDTASQSGKLVKEGDFNFSGAIDLADAITGLKILTGTDFPETAAETDITGDKKIGLEDVIMILRYISNN